MRYVNLFLALLLCAGAAFAQRTDSCSCGIPGTVPTSWEIRHSDPNAQQAAVNSFNLWNLYVDVHRTTVGSPVSYDLGNGRNEILFFDFGQVPGLDPSTVGFAPSLPQGAFGDFNACPAPPSAVCGSGFNESDVWLSDKITWSISRPNVDNPADAGYYYSTAVHEIGHTMGFHHNFGNVSTMNYYQDFAGQFISRADVLAARRQFPSRTRQVTDLATYAFRYNVADQGGSFGNAAVTPASVSPQSVAPGGTVVIRNWTIENLSNNPVNPTRLRFYLSTDANITTDDIYIGGFRWEPLTTWSEDPDGHEFTIPPGTPAGSYYVGAIAGYNENLTLDPITYNNSWFLPGRISITGPQGNPTPCVPTSTRACLAGDRFGVEVQFKTPDGAPGTGNAIKYTSNSALFWFFGADNIEMIVKVLDACPSRFWVFGASATSLEYTIAVTDSHTGKTKTYSHAPNTPTVAITDTNAFDTCGQ